VDAETLLTTTRSVRRKLDLDRPVEAEVLEDCLRVAQQAPIAGAFLDGFRWLVVRDETLKARLAVHVREPGLASQAAYGHLAVPRNLESGRYLLDRLERVPVYVLACLRGTPGGSNAMLSAFYGSVYPAVWSLQLALRSRGLGSTIVGYHLVDRERQVAEILGIPDDVTQVAMLAVGYTTTRDFKPAARPAIREITYYDRWGAVAAES
jgi:nitroreductase